MSSSQWALRDLTNYKVYLQECSRQFYARENKLKRIGQNYGAFFKVFLACS